MSRVELMSVISLCHCRRAQFVTDLWHRKGVGKNAGSTEHCNVLSSVWTEGYSLPFVFIVITWILHGNQSRHWINTCWKVPRLYMHCYGFDAIVLSFSIHYVDQRCADPENLNLYWSIDFNQRTAFASAVIYNL